MSGHLDFALCLNCEDFLIFMELNRKISFQQINNDNSELVLMQGIRAVMHFECKFWNIEGVKRPKNSYNIAGFTCIQSVNPLQT